MTKNQHIQFKLKKINQNTDCPPLLSVIATVQRVVHLELMLCQGLQPNSSWLAGPRDAQTQTQLLSLSPLSKKNIHSVAHVKVSCLSQGDQVRSH